MESKTYLKNIQISPKKLRFYLQAVKKMSPSQSLDFLFYGKQKATQILYKAVQSAISNAKQALKVDADLLNFKLLTIEEGRTLKRYRPGARGNVRPIKRKMSHIKIILAAKEEAKKTLPKVEETKKEDKKLKIEKTTAKAKVSAEKKK